MEKWGFSVFIWEVVEGGTWSTDRGNTHGFIVRKSLGK
jgi:hypothetical protein